MCIVLNNAITNIQHEQSTCGIKNRSIKIFQAGLCGLCLHSQLLWMLRWKDHVSQEVQDQPRQHSETLSPPNKIKQNNPPNVKMPACRWHDLKGHTG
jgi:hypothetical protein